MVVGSFDCHDNGLSTSCTVSFEIPVKHLSRQVCDRNQACRRHRRGTSTYEVDVPDTEFTQISSHVGYDPPIGTHFPHTATFFPPPTLLTFGCHFNITLTSISVFGYTVAATLSSATPYTSFHPINEFEDDLTYIFNFLGTLMDFSPAFQMDADSALVYALSTMSIDRFCLRCSQTPVVDPSVDDEEGQMPEGVQTPPRRSERLHLQQDLPYERLHWQCGCSTTQRNKGMRLVGG